MRPVLLLALALATGCDQLSTPGDVVSQTEGTSTRTHSTEGRSHARWTTAHDGIELSTAGQVSLVPDRGAAIDVLHVRIDVSPRAGTFSEDASSASLEVPEQPAVHPIAVNARVPTLPIARVDPGHVETLDLFFPLPADRAGVWGVFSWSRGATSMRALVPLTGDGNGKPAMSGNRWWFSSSYDWSTFRHQDGIVTASLPTSATVPQLTDQADDPILNPCDQW